MLQSDTVHVYELYFLKLEALIPAWSSTSIPGSQMDRGCKGPASDPRLFLSGTVISFPACISSPKLLPNTRSLRETSVNLCNWHELFHCDSGHWWQKAERNVWRGESVLYIKLFVKYENYKSNAIYIKYVLEGWNPRLWRQTAVALLLLLTVILLVQYANNR